MDAQNSIADLYILRLQLRPIQIMENKEQSAIPLIQCQNGKFSITEEAIHFLNQFDEPIGVVTIVGKYRTGKSLFLNKVLLQNANSFRVCPTINSCTKGLWMSHQIIESQHPEHPHMKAIVIDTEGFGAMEESDAYCNQILLLALLISSYFIYNSVGSIDEKSLNNLNVITNLAKQLQSKNMTDENLEEEFPSFLWLVRDFTLKIVDESGCPLDPKGYLEEALQIRKGVSDAIEGKNKIRRIIKHFFKERDCFTMVTPVANEKLLQQLADLENQDFRPEFLEQAATLREKILKRIKPKRLKSRKITGPTLIELIHSFTSAINGGSLPNLQSTWKQINHYEIKRGVDKVKQNLILEFQQYSTTILGESEASEIEKEMLMKSYERCKGFISCVSELNRHYEDIKAFIGQEMSDLRLRVNKNASEEILNYFYENPIDFRHEKITAAKLQKEVNKTEQLYLKQFASNPCLNQFMVEKLYPKLIEQTVFLCKCLEKTNDELIANHQSDQQRLYNRLHSDARSHQEALVALQAKQRQLIISSVKLQEQVKKKDLELNFQLKQIADLRTRNLQLTGKTEQLQQSLEKLKLEAFELRKGSQQISQLSKDANDNLKYAAKQVEILKNNLSYKTNQIASLKQSIIELQCEVSKAEDREKSTVQKYRLESQNRQIESQQLQSKCRQSNKQVFDLSQQLAKCETRMQMQQNQHENEKILLEEMIETLKKNLDSEYKNKDDLIEANSNLGFAMKHLEQRFQHAQQKQSKLKEFKKLIKNSSCLQCQNCSKFFVPSIFGQHLNICMMAPESLKENLGHKKVNSGCASIKVTQTLLKDSDSKPYTQYVLEVEKLGRVWTIYRKYKQFCDLHSFLQSELPGVVLSGSSFIVNPHEGTKKSLLVDERRKILQKYLNDLAQNPLVFNSQVWKDFIESDGSKSIESIESADESAMSQMMRSHVLNRAPSGEEDNLRVSNKKSPEEFLKVWNERNLRVKQVSRSKKLK